MFSNIIGFMILFITASLITCSTNQRPNVIIIVADDLGFTDVGFHGSNEIATPNLDALAYDGIILNNYYVQPICTPTRSALMSARYPIHTGLQHGVISPAAPYGLGLNETIFPQYLKKLDYATHIVGKWHLGFYRKEYTPLYRGFDSHLGYYGGKEDYWDHTLAEERNHEWGLDFHDQEEDARNCFGQYSTEVYAQRAQRIIQQHNSSKPLFLYLPFQSVHSANKIEPLQAPYKYYQKMNHIKDKNRRMYAAMVSALDDAVGNVTASLHEHGLLKNSLIIFTTDNGGPAGGFDYNYASNYPLRGIKELLWEGGVRGAGFVWSPLLQKSGYTSNHMVHVTDWLPSVLKAVGCEDDDLQQRHLDGVNVWDALSTDAPTSPRKEILLNIDPKHYSYALRVGDTKIIYGKAQAGRFSGWIKPETDFQANSSVNTLLYESALHKQELSVVKKVLKDLGRYEVTPHPAIVQCGIKPRNASTNCNVAKAPCLYNMKTDPCEYNNLANEMPDVVHMLMKKLKNYHLSMVPPKNKPDDPAAYPERHHGVWGPWVK